MFRLGVGGRGGAPGRVSGEWKSTRENFGRGISQILSLGSEFLRNIGTLGSSISSGGNHGWFPIIFWVGIQNAEYELVADRQEGDLDREGAGGAPGGGWEKLNPSGEFVFGGGLTKVLCLYLGSPERCRKKMGY